MTSRRMPPSVGHSTEYEYIANALKARWPDFVSLEHEVSAFVPRTLPEVLQEQLDQLPERRLNNPHLTEAQLRKGLEDQAAHLAHPELQTYLRYADRIMGQYVTVTFLSHALVESAINALLAIGLAMADTSELFSLLERSDVKEKWVSGPKAFHPAYAFQKGGALYQTLQHLVRQRNAFVHYKAEVSINGQVALEGSRTAQLPLRDHLVWMRRYFSLPYDLCDFARKQVPDASFFILHDRGTIERHGPHTEA